jgi:Domain of unknown function (DUF1877)
MGVTVSLKQISPLTLEIFKQDPKQVELFYDAQWLQSSAFCEPYASQFKQDAKAKLSGSVYQEQFISEWAIADLDLHKYWPELTYLLAGYIPRYSDRDLALPELKVRSDLMEEGNFMEFLIIDNSNWDGRPLVNAIFSGTQIEKDGADWYQTPEEVKQILDALQEISRKGFRKRFRREAKSEKPCPWFDWEEEEMLDWLTDYYNEMVKYYQNTTESGNAILGNVS